MIMKWISIKDKKPETDCTCYVMNSRGGDGAFIALYQKYHNIFKMYDPKMYNHPCIDVTHWYPLPEPYVD